MSKNGSRDNKKAKRDAQKFLDRIAKQKELRQKREQPPLERGQSDCEPPDDRGSRGRE